MELRERIEAELARREKVAQEATPGPWEHVDYADPYGQPMTKDGEQSTFMGCGSVITTFDRLAGRDIAAPNGDLYPRGGYSPSEDMAHIAAHDPADALRRYAAARRVLERHRPMAGDPRMCRACTDGLEVRYPCAEIVDLADSLGLSTESGEGV